VPAARRRLAATRQSARDMRERLLQLRPHGGAEPGQARPRLAVEQRCAEFVLELANRVGQRRLGNAAAPGGAGEVQLLARREKIDDLPDFHAAPSIVRGPHLG